MKTRKLGYTYVSAVGYGCMGITHASGAPLTLADGVKAIHQAIDTGYTFFDTAECYTGIYPDGQIAYNEDIAGAALRHKRDQIILATKCGVSHAADRSLILDSSPESIRRSIEKSLKRLCTDHIDLYYQHRIDPKVEPECVAETMAQLIKEGKIIRWGISETTEEYLRRAHAVCPVSAIQNRYSMLARWHEKLFPVVEELGITYVAFSPLANGFLSACYSADTQFEGEADYRAAMPQYTEEGFKRATGLLSHLRTLAAQKEATLAQIALAWILCKKPYIIPIPGSRKEQRIKENFGAAEIVLTPSEISEIDALLDSIDVPVFGGHSAVK